MPVEIRKFTKAGIALLNAIEQRHSVDMRGALMDIADDLGLDMDQEWNVNLKLNQFERAVPTPPPSSTVAPPMPARVVPMPPPAPPTPDGATE